MRSEILEKLSCITEEEKNILEGKKEVDRSLYAEDGSFVIDRRKLLNEGSLIQIRTHTRFAAFPEHSHNYVEMVYMCEGTTRHKVDGTPIELNKGEILIMNQNARQSIEPAKEKDIAVNFIILPEFFDTSLRMLGHQDSVLKDFLSSVLTSKDVPMSYLLFQVSDNIPIQNLMENLIVSLLYEEADAKTDELTMGLLFLQLMKQTGQMKTDKKSYERKLVLDALSYMDVHYRDGSLTEFAEGHHCELTMLSRLISKMTGFSWQELLQQKRMASACELLETTDVSVSDIAVAVGYENISFFHRLFKRYNDCSPRQYRISHKK